MSTEFFREQRDETLKTKHFYVVRARMLHKVLCLDMFRVKSRKGVEDMSVAEASSVRKHPAARAALIAGFSLAGALVLALLVRYPGDADTRAMYLGGGAVALFTLLVSGWAAARGTRTRSANAASALLIGTKAGLLLGALWVVEIGVVNFLVAPGVVVPSLRDPISVGAVVAVASLTVVLGAVSAFRTRRLMAGVRVGFWSGLVGGLIACLTRLLLASIFTGFVVWDPLSVREWAERGRASGAPDAATYWAYETMTGALLGHLLLQGIVMGTVLGAVGGVIGWGLSAARGGGRG